MKNNDFSNKIKPILQKAKSQGDHYLIVHFSKEDDHFIGEHSMDQGDALIVICEIMKNFQLKPEVVSQMNINL